MSRFLLPDLSQRTPGRTAITAVLLAICAIWTAPTLGMIATSFRTADAAASSGWWTVPGTPEPLTLDNYRQVLFGQRFSMGGTARTDRGTAMAGAIFASLAVAVPSILIPAFIASAAAFGFAWLRFRGRGVLFAIIIALLAVPVQISLIPILRDYQRVGLNGTYPGIWLAHTGFGLPLATYIMYNYISTLPRNIMESALINGASHFTVFMRIVLPLSMPALASFAIFQFIWVWNDVLVSLVFLAGVEQKMQVLTVRLMNMAGTRSTDWHLLTAGALLSTLLPMALFLCLQKFFVRGLLASSVKG